MKTYVASGAGVLTLVACLALPHPVDTKAQTDPAAITELTWIDPSAEDIADILTHEPVDCLKTANNADEADRLRTGELAFASPALLGGQAEKKRLSCASCHRNGRDNPHFLFPAISGVAGTADVTSGLFGVERADRTFNPLPIPDLADPATHIKADRTDTEALQEFIRLQIIEEFSGDEPSPSILKAVTAYVEAVSNTACTDPSARQKITWQSDFEAARDAALRASAESSTSGETFWRQTARASLRRLYERYAAPQHGRLRKELIDRSRQIADGADWPEGNDPLEARLAGEADSSLYNPDILNGLLEDKALPPGIDP